MNPADSHTVTRLLERVRAGEHGATDSLAEVLYTELRGIAGALVAKERRDHTLQPTALVHEAWMRVAPHVESVRDRVHFLAIAARAMRRILVDYARRAKRQKRGADRKRVTLDETFGWMPAGGLDLVALNDSLDVLARLNERHARVVELRVLGGLTIAESADILGVSHTTIESDWFTAKAWLRTELGSTE
ncbi:MAG: ECF-type sigma factor [Planctomycetota bacterium]